MKNEKRTLGGIKILYVIAIIILIISYWPTFLYYHPYLHYGLYVLSYTFMIFEVGSIIGALLLLRHKMVNYALLLGVVNVLFFIFILIINIVINLLLGFGFYLWPVSYFNLSELILVLVMNLFLIKFRHIKRPKRSELELRLKEMESKKIELSTDIIHKDESKNDDILVFISYATKDAGLFKIKEIAKKLRVYKDIKEVMYWQESMKDNIFKYMNDNLGKCNIMLLFCSPNALISKPVEKEWTAMDSMGKPIIPIFLKSDHIPPLLKSRLGLEYDSFDFQKNIQNLHELILKKKT